MKVLAYFISALVSVGILVFAFKQIVSLIRDVRDRVKKKSSSDAETKADVPFDQSEEKEVKK